jgi:Na+/melibiose symporter-like transporter
VTTPARRAGFKEYFDLFKRPAVVRLLITDFLVGTGPSITGALFFFFFERVKGFDKGTASFLLLIYFIGGLVGAPLWNWMAHRIGKHRALAVSGVAYAAMTMCALLIPLGNVAVAGVLMFLIGVPYAAGAFLLRAMMADVSDQERLQGGVDRTALLYAILAGTVKIGSALAVFVTFPLLQALGFDPAAKGVDTGLAGVAFVFSAVPAGMALAASWLIMGFPLTAQRHEEIRNALAERDLAEAAPEMGSNPRFTEEIHAAAKPAE